MEQQGFWASEARSNTIFENSPIGIELYDTEGQLVLANKACLEIFGIASPDDVKGFKLFEDPNLTEEVIEILRSGETVRYESRFDFQEIKERELFPTSKSGIIYLDVLISPVNGGGDGALSGYLVQVQNITRSKLAQFEATSNREMWDKTFAAVDEGLFVIDEYNNVIQCNPAFARIVGKSPQELIGKKCHEIVHDSEVMPGFCIADRALKERRVIHEVIYEPSLGKYVEVNANAVESLDGGATFVVHTIRDVTEQKEAEDRLKQSEARYYDLYKQAPVAYFSVGIDGYVRNCNQTGESFIGYSIDELRNMRFIELYAEESKQKAVRLFKQFKGGHTIREEEMLYRRKDGEKVYGLLSVSPVRDEQGNVVESRSVIMDITIRKRALEKMEKSEERLRDIFENTSDLIQSVAPDGRLMYTNRAWRQALGYTDEEAKDLNVFDIIHPASTDHCIDCFSRVMSGETLEGIEAIFISKGGDSIVVEGNVSCRFEGETPVGTRAIFRDITERKLAEYEISRFSEEIARSNRELENYAYIASHDLQEPLRMITSYLQLLEKEYGDELDSEALNYISFAVDGATRMNAMIDGLLAYSRVDTRRLEPALIDCGEALGKALANLEVAIEESGAKVTYDHLPRVMGDEVQLTQVFQNLIANALKFRREDSPEIHVSVRDEHGEWVFSISDNGIGIEPEYGDRIFTIFQRLHTPEEYQGTGIGLALAKKIIERHKGRIWVDSVPGKGSTFHFTITAE